jgi:hypothetical protein
MLVRRRGALGRVALTMEAASRRRMPVPSRRLGLAILTSAVGAALTALVIDVPVGLSLPSGRTVWLCAVSGARLPHALRERYWWVAIVAALIVVAADTVVVAVTVAATVVRRRRAQLPPSVPASTREARLPAPLHLERIPVRIAWITAAASGTLLLAGLLQGYAMWVWVALGIAPWLPLLVCEAAWKYEHYGLWAVFGVAVLLQIGHMGEHTVQVAQLVLYGGHLSRAHGVFGQLDFETIHFFWDTAVWVFLCVLLPRFGAGNRWLWIAFAAASLHEVEHLYLYYVYRHDPSFYVLGGLEGIMGDAGVIGTPLARPYLHFAYNYLVVVPMVLAFWDQSMRVQLRSRSSPDTVTNRGGFPDHARKRRSPPAIGGR